MFWKKIFLYILSLLKSIFRFSFLISVTLLLLSYFASYLHPVSCILLPAFTLMFPVLLFLNIIWIIFFSITLQYKKLVIALVLQIFFFSDVKKFYNISFSENVSHSKNILSAMSFNVKLFDLYNWQNNYDTRKKIFDYLKNHPADIMCFQEFYTSEDSNDFNNIEELKEIFPNYYFHAEYFVTLRKNDHWGLLTMSKFPIVKQSVMHFNNAKNNGCIFTDILFNKDTIRVFNLHLQSYSLYKKKKWKPNQKPDTTSFFESLDSSAKGLNLLEKLYNNNILKVQQAESILEIVKSTHYPILLIGDFNDIAHSYIMRIIQQHQLTDAFIEKGNGLGITYHDKIFLRIDYIFHSPDFKTLDFITENNSQTQHISDHYPIRALFELRK